MSKSRLSYGSFDVNLTSNLAKVTGKSVKNDFATLHATLILD